jgi:flagellar biosynthesis protein FlhB
MGAGEDAGEKNFDPTPRRLQRLREQGNVPKSRELSQIATFAVAVIFLVAGSAFIWQQIRGMFINLWSAIPLKTFGAIGPGFIVWHAVKPFVLIIIPLFLIVSFTAILADFAQVGFLFSTNNFFKFDAFNPTNYFKRIFSLDGVVDLLRQILKVLVLGFVAWKILNKHWLEILGLINAPTVQAVAHVLREVILDYTIQATAILLIVGFADFAYQRFRYIQKNRMSLKEMMDEMKESEGDPFVKAQRRQMARRLTQRRQLSNVPEADFITTNPSKIAVAIKYSSGQMSAPKVVAKGSDAFAWRIISVARENEVPVIENIPLARALFKLVKVDQEVPPELYRAVAEVLLFAYQIRGKAKFR